MKTYVMVAALFSASLAAAQEKGSAILRIGDVEQSFGIGTASDYAGSAAFPSVSLVLVGPRDNNITSVSSINLGLELSGDAISHAEARMAMQVDGERVNRWCGDEPDLGGLTVELEHVTIEGEILTLSGKFTCDFGTSENFGRDIDLGDPVTVSGTFSATLQRLE